MFFHEELKRSYRTVQLSGRVNMLCMYTVRDLAEAYRLTDLVEFIDDFPSEYSNLENKVDWEKVEPFEKELKIMT